MNYYLFQVTRDISASEAHSIIQLKQLISIETPESQRLIETFLERNTWLQITPCSEAEYKTALGI